MSSDLFSSSRRNFLQSTAGLGSAAVLSPAAKSDPTPLPKVTFGKTEITRLIIGSNPLYGFSHFNPVLNAFMKEYMTDERRMEILHRAERAGINTWQLHYTQDTIADFKRYRAEGGKMNWFLLGHGDMMADYSLAKDVAKLGPIGIAHHGSRTDDLFRDRQMEKAKDFCKVVRDTGVMVGVSTHNPAVVDFIEGAGWDIDYFMTCMYRVTRTLEEARQQFGEAPVGETYMEKDPVRMTSMVRQTKHPCLAFKIFGAGRTINNKQQVEDSFKFVYENIKPTDAIIVGMCPKFKDEVTENAGMAVKFGQRKA